MPIRPRSRAYPFPAPPRCSGQHGGKNARTQEFVRAGITFSFLLILVLMILWGCWESRSWKDHWEQTKELLQIILPALTGLLGSSLGFYFGRTASSPAGASNSSAVTSP